MRHKGQKYVCHLTTPDLFGTKSVCRATVKIKPELELIGAEGKFTEELCKPEKLICLW